MAARFPNRSGGEAAANSRATSGERGPVAGNGLAQSLAAIARRDRGPVRFGRKKPDEKDTSRFRAATARAAAIDRADVGRAGGGESSRGTISGNVSGDGGVVASAGGDRRRWRHYHRNRGDEQRVGGGCDWRVGRVSRDLRNNRGVYAAPEDSRGLLEGNGKETR